MFVSPTSNVTASVVQNNPRAVLQPSDFEMIGAMRVPVEVTGFTEGGLALRRTPEGPRLLMTGHRQANDPLFLFDVPGFDPVVAKAPRARLLSAIGDIYRGRKRVANVGNQIWTGDIEWHDEKLFWVYGDSYNVVGTHDPSLGFTDATGESFGPWHTSLHSHLTQGYITTIPQWYADRYLGGRRLGLGSGLVSGNIRSSWGPMLAAIAAPTQKTPTTEPIQAVPLVQYSYEQRLPREDNYIPLTRPPDRPGGWWTQQDRINGAVWIDLPDKHGVVFFASLGAGYVWYGGRNAGPDIRDPCVDWQGPHASRYDARWYIYDPMKLAPAGGGNPADQRPTSVFNPDLIGSADGGCLNRTTGAVFDPETRVLLIVNLEGEPMKEFSLPVVYAYRIR